MIVLTALLSVAKLSFFISAWASARASTLALALKLVIGVDVPLVEAPGVDFEDPDRPFSEFFAAFSASLFCLLADGAMMGVFFWLLGVCSFANCRALVYSIRAME